MILSGYALLTRPTGLGPTFSGNDKLLAKVVDDVRPQQAEKVFSFPGQQ